MTHLLIDGCYCLNFPVEAVRQMGAGIVLTVDVNALYEHIDPDFGDTCSGWDLLWRKWALSSWLKPFSQFSSMKANGSSSSPPLHPSASPTLLSHSSHSSNSSHTPGNSHTPHTAPAPVVPTSASLQDRISNLWNSAQQRRTFDMVDLAMRPPIDGFGLLEFQKFTELMDLGHDYALPLLKDFLENTEKGAELRLRLGTGSLRHLSAEGTFSI